MSFADDLTKEHIDQCLARARDFEFGRWFLVTVSLVAESHPDLLRDALGKVFDLKHLNRQVDQIAKRYKQGLELLRKLEGDVQRLEDLFHVSRKTWEKRLDELRLIEEQRMAAADMWENQTDWTSLGE